MADGIFSFKEKNDDLVVMARDAAVIATPYGVGAVPTKLTGVGGSLITLPTNWLSFGELDQQAGITITPDQSTADVRGYGSMGPRRVVKTEESVTLGFSPQESRNLAVSAFWGLDMEDLVADANGEWQAKKSYASSLQYWSLILLSADENKYGDVYNYWIFPKVSVTQTDAISLATDSAMVYPLTFTAFEDAEYGGFMAMGAGGPGQAAVNVAAGFAEGS
ncbi:major tail protein [Gordonia phage Rabbitrun]|uniref:Major tail protein n=1 Tax=Gordonia phage Rabbitrun TaxID=2762280 RepID=A0A7G8LIJ5_9CAUD|nr:major tail protein [Gordonia phage Rabbitrun]QNJ57067.1 major tail protein [Gordonia phage Rabbitrun]